MNNSDLKEVDIKELVSSIMNKKIRDFYDVPEELRSHIDIVKIERKMRLTFDLNTFAW